MSDSDPKPDGIEADPAKLIPLETARANLLHWWREPIAGLASLVVGCWDTWHYGREGGLSTNVDEILVLGGIVLIAGSRRLFAGPANFVASRQPDKGPGP